jgi:D-sedoheptulose 7-phosphate isomerase
MKINKHPQNYFDRLKKAMDSVDQSKVSEFIKRIHSIIGTEITIFIAGNGGSASTSSHMACDLSKTILGSTPRKKEVRLRVICLNESVPLMTAWSNDEGYEHIFSEQIRSLGRKNDILFVITGSGNSKNMVAAIHAAKNRGMATFGILGFDGGKAKKLLDDYLLVKSKDYGIVEDMHMVMVHLVTDWLKKNLQ